MSYSCYICKVVIQGGTRALFTHLRSVHFVCELRGVTLKCGQGDCVRSYGTFNSLLCHLREQHPIELTRNENVSDNRGYSNVVEVLPITRVRSSLQKPQSMNHAM